MLTSRAAVSYATRAPAGSTTSTIWIGEGKLAGEKLRRTEPDCGSRHGIRSARLDSGLAGASAGSKSVASGTPSPVAIFSSTTAVGLLSPRSTSEIIERLTSHFAASASRVMPRSVRSVRTQPAMRELMSGVAVVAVALSFILDALSSKMDPRSTGLELELDDAGRDGAGVGDQELGDRDGQLESPRPGAARVDEQNALSLHDQGLVRVARNHYMNAGGRRLDVELREVVDGVHTDAPDPEQFGLT